MQKNLSKNLSLIEKYRPKTLNNIVGQDIIINLLKRILNNCKKNKESVIPNFLFYGLPGTGKTTTILAFCYELYGPLFLKERVLELNASCNNGIDDIRKYIIPFTKIRLCDSENFIKEDKREQYFKKYPVPPYKFIILDEADSLSNEAQASLRKVLEESQNTRFCIICNYFDKIIKPIVSRCIFLNFVPINIKAANKRLEYIIKKENLNINKQEILDSYYKYNGDLRYIINIIQEIEN